MADQLARRRDTLADLIRGSFDQRLNGLQRELEAVAAEERELKREQEAIIARLEPKIAQLTALSGRARDVARMNAPVEPLVDRRQDAPTDRDHTREAI